MTPPDTRLTSVLPPPGFSEKNIPAVYFRRLANDRILLTNEAGQWAVLNQTDFNRYLQSALPAETETGRQLAERNLLRDHLNFSELADKIAQKELLNWPGPSVHTVVTTLRCNFRCLYCHASVVDPSQTRMDMTPETAKKTVDFIFSTPNPSLHIEFQGGEPLLNWPVVRFIAQYARLKKQWLKRDARLSLISNLSLLDEHKLDFLEKHKISICTSLDGPEDLHNGNRIYLGGNTHEQVTGWIEKIQARRKNGADLDAPNAICTVTRNSLRRGKEIVDQLAELGLERVQLGPLEPVGFARKSWEQIGYEPEEFVEFYAETLDRILKLNRQGVKIYEKMALIFLIRILSQEHWRFPNGDALCRLAYHYDGGIYTSEEGRLLASEGDPLFQIGRVGETSYEKVLEHPAVKTSVLASRTDAQPLCFSCAYKPYCSVLPVMNYATQGSPWGQMPSNRWCRTVMGIFDILFQKLNGSDAEILKSWLEFRTR